MLQKNPTASSDMLLSLSDLTVEYHVGQRHVQAITDAFVEVGRGEGVGIVGESGSGKSTLVRVLTGLLPSQARITSGRMSFDGATVHPNDMRALQKLRGRGMAMIFQDPLSFLNPLLSIGSQISEAVMLNHPEENRKRRVCELLDMVHLPLRCIDSYPHELSGGMRQRALIAIALACRPKLLIADEPTTALDVTTQAEILALLKEIRREIGMSVLLISHDMGVVSALCDHIYVMYRGNTIETGTQADVLLRPSHGYTRALIYAARSMKGPDGRFLTLKDPTLDPAEETAPVAELEGVRSSIEAIDAEAAELKAAKPISTARPVARLVRDAPILEIKDASRTYRLKNGEKVAALKPTNLTIRPGEIVALVGESGSGKSTLAKIALSLEQPDSGDVILAGTSARQLSTAELRRRRLEVQPVFQDPSAAFNPRRSVAEALKEAVRCRADRPTDPSAAAIEALERVGLAPGEAYLKRFPHELSGGQRQRLGLARALAARPRLIVADEPLSGADVSIRGQILNLLLQLKEEDDLALLFITHDISIAEVFADRVLVMHRGVVVEEGRAAEVLSNPAHDYTRMMKAAVPSIRLLDELEAASA
ncbi:putative Glutathione import ATP-binding protein GsiA [Hyphomicrobiales bacterium]|nr:putative Glutathione import ATP-binding protein GsiA [Hyphomicrobiales bacterium]CAH1676940.1 putative Glutathione import ATP-binding protein GsiA [Hyphomicrobiales bacterium]